MARYFKFKTLDDLKLTVESLGLSLRAQEDLGPLFGPASVAGRTVGNRCCIQPMEGCDGDADGKPGELTLRRYRRFGSGGAKLIWGEAAAVVPEGRANPRQLLATPAHVGELARVVRSAREAHRQAFGQDNDLVIGLQLTHSGRYCFDHPVIACHDPLLDRRTVINKQTGAVVDRSYPLISDDELARLVDAYVSSARTARDAGFDFVDVKQCHRYLLNELLSAHTRPGKYGGSLENRTRLARTIIGRIRHEVPDLFVASRLSVFDGVPFQRPDVDQSYAGLPDTVTGPLENHWGTNPNSPLEPDLTEPFLWVAQMRQLGVALMNTTLGNPYASPHYLRPFEHPPLDAYSTPEHPLVGVDRHLRLTAQLQGSQPDLPVVGSGYSWLQEFLFQVAAASVAEGRATFVGLGRAALAQPDATKQLMEHGRLDRKRICRTFSYCTALMRSKHNDLGQFPAGCPPFDKNTYGPIWKSARR